jgi:hypothetical protein
VTRTSESLACCLLYDCPPKLFAVAVSHSAAVVVPYQPADVKQVHDHIFVFSLTRGWVCNLLVQLLLGLARAVTLGSKFRRTHDHILLSHLKQVLGRTIPHSFGALWTA